MHRIAAFVVVGLFVFASTLPAGAQSIRESAERLARRSASVQPGAPLALRGRSMVRTWAGVGLVAGGLAMMFTGQDDCVATGSLAQGRQVGSDAYATYAVSGGNLHAVREHTDGGGFSGCYFRFSVSGTETDTYRGSVSNIGEHLRSGNDDTWWEGFYGGALDRLRNDANVKAVRPKFRLWGGAAMVAGGALLATVWADAPVDVSGDVRQVRLSRTIGW